jgi:hypothetical protein
MDIFATIQGLVPCTFRALVQGVHLQHSDVRDFCARHTLELRPRDKGKWGKMVEFYLFGRLPNNDPLPDLGVAVGDIKATHFKQTRDGWNAKERLTVTNCGSTANYDSFQNLLVDMKDSSLYPKLRRGMLVALKHGTHPDVWDECVLGIVHYDLEALPEDMQSVLRDDYAKIQHRIRTQTVSQSGQQFLHIHPHGSKGSSTRALGFTNKFVTQLLCYYTNRPLRVCGRSWVFSI